MIYSKKSYYLILVCLIAFTSVFAQQSNSNKSVAATKSVKSNGSSSPTMRGGWHWGKFYDDGPEDGPYVGCMPGGIICQDDPIGTDMGPIETEKSSSAGSEINPDETIGEIEITLDGNSIVITETGDTSSITKETLDKFSTKSVEKHNSGLPKGLVEKLFEKINLKMPEEKIVFSAADQTYAVINSTHDGKPVQIINVTEKTKLNIDGKEYNLTLNATSGKADKYKNQMQTSLFFGGGITNPMGSQIKDSAFLGSGFNFNEGIYCPLFEKKSFTGGIEGNINYSNLNASSGLSNVQQSKVINGGSTAPDYIGELPKATSFKFLVGPRLNFDINKFHIAPSVLIGYQTIKRDAFTIADSVNSINDPTNKIYIPSLSAGILKSNGFVVKPKIEAGYRITPEWSVWASYDISFGPTMKNSYETFVPGGNPDSSGAYFIDQYLNGTIVTRETDVKWQTGNLNIGVAYAFGKTKESTSEAANSPSPQYAIRGKVKDIKSDIEVRQSSANHSEVSENKLGGQNPTVHPGHVTIQRTKTDTTNKTQSSNCNTNVDTVTVNCNGFDKNGNMTYAVTVKFSNLLTVGTTYLGSVITTGINPVAPNSSSPVISLLGGSATWSTPTPGGGTVLPAPSTTNINFNITPSGSGPITLQVLSGSIITGAGLPQGSNCPHSFMIDSFPTCICSYCNDSMTITDVNESATYAPPNMAAIHQEFSVAPKNIVKITAEIAYIKDSVTSEDCRVCSQNENEVFQFVSTNTASGLGGPNYGNGTALPPSRTVTWSSSSGGVNLSAPNKVNIDLHVGLPALSTLDCCNQWETICIRYTFWDISCKACDRLVCYTVKKH